MVNHSPRISVPVLTVPESYSFSSWRIESQSWNGSQQWSVFLPRYWVEGKRKLLPSTDIHELLLDHRYIQDWSATEIAWQVKAIPTKPDTWVHSLSPSAVRKKATPWSPLTPIPTPWQTTATHTVTQQTNILEGCKGRSPLVTLQIKPLCGL